MARRDDIEARGTQEIFSLSFLDVFACALGALVLILLMIFNQVTSAFDPKVVQEKIEQMRAKRQAVVDQVTQGREAAELAAKYDQEAPALQQRVTELETRLEMAASPGTVVTPAQLEQARQQAAQLRAAVEGVKDRVVRRRRDEGQGRTPLVGGGPSVAQEPRLLEVFDGKVRDVATGETMEVGSSEWNRFQGQLAGARAKEYPLFIVRPSGVEGFSELEKALEDSGLPYGYEPYTKIWDPMLSGERRP